MTCHSPRKAWPKLGGGYVFNALKSYSGAKEKLLPCGQCLSCRCARASEWATRMMHELRFHPTASFLTLTYAPEHLPPLGALVKSDVQDFIALLRTTLWRRGIKVRYFLCGEYGENGTKRPHYHVILFGYDFPDRVPFKVRKGEQAFTSEELTALWGKGFCELGTVTEKSCNYVARYVVKKQNGDAGAALYTRSCECGLGEPVPVQPPFVLMSTRPGIGAKWFDAFGGDAFPSGFVIHDGQKRPAPRYYWKRFKRDAELRRADEDHKPDALDAFGIHREVHQIERRRGGFAAARADDNTPERMATKAESLALKMKRAVRVFDDGTDE